MIEFINENKEWLFSGIGLSLGSWLIMWLLKRKEKKARISNFGNTNIKASKIHFSQTVFNQSNIETGVLEYGKVENSELSELKKVFYGEQKKKRNFLFSKLSVAYKEVSRLEVRHITDIAEDENHWRPDEIVEELKKLEREGVIRFDLMPGEPVSPYTVIRLTPLFFENIK